MLSVTSIWVLNETNTTTVGIVSTVNKVSNTVNRKLTYTYVYVLL